MSRYKNQKKKNRKRILLIVFILFAIFGAGILLLEETGTTNLFANKRTISDVDKNAKSSSKIDTAQSDFKNGDNRSTNKTIKEEGSVTDKNGAIITAPPENQWSKSTDGYIVVYSPAHNSTIRSGQPIEGSSNEDRVYFRLSDNVAGVIAQGSISVVNGKYSGVLNFSSNGTEGEVEVFHQAPDGRESSNVSVLVKF
jgi:ABC-type Na+ efflux pump permease subunit